MSTPLLTVSASPHILGRATVRGMHLETLLALAPALFLGFYFFGIPAVTVVVITTISAVVFEYLITKLAKQPNRLNDFHAVLMGVLLGMILPAGAPWWVAMVGGFLTVVLAKALFGGLGGYPMHPVLIAWAALYLSWPEHMNAFFAPFTTDVAQTSLMKARANLAYIKEVDLNNLWTGLTPGSIGATSGLALAIGGVYLMLRRKVNWHIPTGVIIGAVLMSLLATYTDPAFAKLKMAGFTDHLQLVYFELASGGLMLAAFFLATEPVSSPVTPAGTWIYGILIGVLAVIIRLWGSYSEGVYFAVLLMSAATPLFDRIRPAVFGKPQRDW